MKKLIVLVAALGALAVAAPTFAATHAVAITKAGFVPDTITIARGDSVVWTNSDVDNHQVVSQRAGFASPVLKAGETYAYTFTKAGKFPYTDAFVKNSRGTVTVEEPPAGVSLHASVALLTFGARVTLSGAVSNDAAGENVDVLRQECGKSTQSQKVTTVQTTTGGAYSYALQPTVKTSYTVRWKNQTSSQVTVNVRPRLRLARVTRTRFTVRAYAGASLAGHAAIVQRWRPSLGRWTTLRYTVLRPNSTGVAPTVISSVTFTAKVPRRTKLRISMTQAQVGSCFAPAVSNAVLS